MSIDTTSALMFGFSLNPTANSSYTNLQYAIYFAAGQIQIYESGNFVATIGAYTTTDLLACTYDGSFIRAYQNGNLIHTQAVSNQTYYFSSSFFSTGAGLMNMSFGPGTTLDQIPTAGMSPNAASQIVSAASSTAIVFSNNGVAVNSNVLTAAITTNGYAVGVDVSATVGAFELLSTFNSPINAYITRDGVQIGTAFFDIYGYVTSTKPASSGPGYSWSTPMTLTVVDTPPAGAHTYALTLNSAAATRPPSGQNGATVGFSNIALKVREYKR
jgi:hypothetical protein